jgi:Tfp pilus assembly protein PilF
MKFNEFIEKCRDNDVWKNLSIYVVSSWVFLQVTDLISEPLGFTPKIVAYCLVLLLICFPIFLFLLWKFRLSQSDYAEGLDTNGEPTPAKIAKKGFKKRYFSMIGIVSLISFGISSFIVGKNFKGELPLPVIKSGDKIAVLQFENLTGNPDHDIIGKMAVDWINHGITRNNLAQVISPKIIEDYSKVLRSTMDGETKNNLVTDYLKPSEIIEGEYYLDGDKLIFQSSITDEVMNRTLISFKSVSCNIDAPLDCLEALNQRILGFFATEGKDKENLEERPPNYNAYKLFNLALTFRQDNESLYLKKLEEAIAADEDYFEPRIYRFMYYFNKEDYATANVYLHELQVKTGLHERQRLLLNLYEALLQGKLGSAYAYQKKEYNTTPFHLETNSNMMVFTLQFVNRPTGVDSIYQEIDMKDFDLSQCVFCEDRYKIKALADIELKNYTAAIALLTPFKNGNEFMALKKILLRAHIRSGDYGTAKAMLSEYQLVLDRELWTDLYLFAAKDFILMGEQVEANALLGEITKEAQTHNSLMEDYPQLLPESLFYSQNYTESTPLLQEVFQKDPTHFYVGTLLAISYAKMGNSAKADDILGTMLAQRAPYQFGDLDYALGQYYAATNAPEQSTPYLMRSVADGHWYETGGFQNDPLLKDVANLPDFKRVMTYWQK